MASRVRVLNYMSVLWGLMAPLVSYAGAVKCPDFFRLFTATPGETSHATADPIARLIQMISDGIERTRYRTGRDAIFYRGIASSDYAEKDLIRYLRGDRSAELRSWDYSRKYNQFLQEGLSPDAAAKKTDREIADRISRELEGYYKASDTDEKAIYEYYWRQVWGTGRDKPMKEKVGTAIAADRNETKFALHYLEADLKKMHKSENRGQKKPAGFVFKIKERAPRGIGLDDEYLILSHVPVQDIEGAFLAVPKSTQSGTGSSKFSWIEWYYVGIQERDSNGAATRLTVRSAALSDREQVLPGDEILNVRNHQVMDLKQSEIMKKNSDLRPLIEALFSASP